jgi:ubiquinone biosynthesis monooxygenase Coq7
MVHAAAEEIDHLAWCEQRIGELGGRTSALNPLWYAMSFGIGAGAGLISDKLSLGFVAATEDQVCGHLQKHLADLPETDSKSRAIVEQMLDDEARHAQSALDAGGYRFPGPVKKLMTVVSSAMTASSYRI